MTSDQDQSTDNSDAAFEEARRRIDIARAEHRTWLDLGDLALDPLPSFLELPDLRVLSLGEWKIWEENGQICCSPELGRGLPRFNDLGKLSDIGTLHVLCLRGCNEITDFGPLQELTKLTILDLSDTKITS